MSRKIELNVKLNIAQEDYKNIMRKAAGCGITLPELLECFLNDLSGGKARGGSDESSLAGEWFERSNFSAFPPHTLLGFLAWNDYDIKEFIGSLSELELFMEDYDAAETDKDKADIWQEIDRKSETIREIFQEYRHSIKEPQDWITGAKGVYAFYKMMETLEGRKRGKLDIEDGFWEKCSKMKLMGEEKP